jgi:hypothetical protein
VVHWILLSPGAPKGVSPESHRLVSGLRLFNFDAGEGVFKIQSTITIGLMLLEKFNGIPLG